jgi:3-oxoacyl-[acyl-carrier protein] reductase
MTGTEEGRSEPARVVWVAAGQFSVGRELARCLLDAGFRVAISGEPGDGLAEFRRLADGNPEALVIERDPADAAGAAEVVTQIQEQLGPLYALINGVRDVVEGPVLDVRPEQWRYAVHEVVTKPLFCSRAAAEAMVERAEGRIVMLSSYTAVRAVAGRLVGGATHASLESMMRIFALELAQHGICVNAVAIGPLAEESAEAMALSVPMRRLGTVTDVFQMVRYLLEPTTTWVTGAVLRLDGGAEATALLVGSADEVVPAGVDPAVAG